MYIHMSEGRTGIPEEPAWLRDGVAPSGALSNGNFQAECIGVLSYAVGSGRDLGF